MRFKGECFQALSLASCLVMEEILKFPNPYFPMCKMKTKPVSTSADAMIDCSTNVQYLE